MRRFVARFVLGIAGAWLADLLIPGVTADRAVTTFLLMGFLVGVGEVALPIVDGPIAVVLFFLPRTLRAFLLRAVVVGIAAALTDGYHLGGQLPVSLGGTTLLLSLLYMVPFAN